MSPIYWLLAHLVRLIVCSESNLIRVDFVSLHVVEQFKDFVLESARSTRLEQSSINYLDVSHGMKLLVDMREQSLAKEH